MNELKVNQQQTIISLFERGWSKRKIARDLDLDRGTVRKYLAAAKAKPATNPQTGSHLFAEPKSPANPQPGPLLFAESKPPTNSQTGSQRRSGPVSVCDPWREEIEKAWHGGFSLQRIYQDLVSVHQFTGSYHAVRRHVLREHGATELPFPSHGM